MLKLIYLQYINERFTFIQLVYGVLIIRTNPVAAIHHILISDPFRN